MLNRANHFLIMSIVDLKKNEHERKVKGIGLKQKKPLCNLDPKNRIVAKDVSKDKKEHL